MPAWYLLLAQARFLMLLLSYFIILATRIFHLCEKMSVKSVELQPSISFDLFIWFLFHSFEVFRVVSSAILINLCCSYHFSKVLGLSGLGMFFGSSTIQKKQKAKLKSSYCLWILIFVKATLKLYLKESSCKFCHTN